MVLSAFAGRSSRGRRRASRGGGGLRTGATVLSLLAAPLNVHILVALEDGDQSLADLNRIVGHPPATTMRAYLKGLGELGAVERRQEADFPGSVTYSLTRSGLQLLAVSSALERWLADAPTRPLALGSPAAKSAIKALVEGWNAGIVRVLAARALAPTELARVITGVSYPTLERRLASMRRNELLQAWRGSRTSTRGNPYGATQWLQEAAPSLFAAVTWEREWAPERTKSLGRIDLEALFLLTIPLCEVPSELSGRCRLAVEMRTESEPKYAGAMVTIESGRPASWATRLEGDADAWITGTAAGWLGWMSGRRLQALDSGGDVPLASSLCEALRDILAPGLGAIDGPPTRVGKR